MLKFMLFLEKTLKMWDISFVKFLVKLSQKRPEIAFPSILLSKFSGFGGG